MKPNQPLANKESVPMPAYQNPKSYNATLSPEFKANATAWAERQERLLNLLIDKRNHVAWQCDKASIQESIDVCLNEIVLMRMALVRPAPKESGIYQVV